MLDPNAATNPSGAGSILGITPAGWLGAASSVLGAALDSSPAAPAVSSATAYTNTSVDHSGWTVSTGKSSASAVGAFPWYVWAAVAVGTYLYFKKSKQ